MDIKENILLILAVTGIIVLIIAPQVVIAIIIGYFIVRYMANDYKISIKKRKKN